MTGPRPPAGLAVTLLDRVLVVLTTAGVLLASVVPDPSRPVLVAAGLAIGAAAAAAATAWRLAGTTALGLATLTALLAGALDASDERPAQVVVAAALLLLTVWALDRAEAPTRPRPVTVLRAPLARWAGPVAMSVGAAGLVAYAAARTVVPSVGLVLAGLAAAVAALVLATRAHRG